MSDRYPFAAIVGQERVKRALLYNLIDPRIGGVVLCGEKGTAKSTIVRGLAELTEQEAEVRLRELQAAKSGLSWQQGWPQRIESTVSQAHAGLEREV